MSARPPEPDKGKPEKVMPSGAKPEWANGLKQLYDSVVDEPLPDSFKDLLSQLDSPSQGKRGPGE